MKERTFVRGLRSLIYAKFDTETDCANALAWSRQQLSKITTGVREPTIAELNELSKVLDISVEQLANIFLAVQSPSEQQIA